VTDLSARSAQPEVMDAPDLDLAVYQRCLADLASVNRVTFTHRATIAWLKRATKDLPRGAAFSVLDVAFGHGDLLRAIASWAEKRGFVVQLSGIDLNPRSRNAARGATAWERNIDFITGDVFDYAPDPLPDYIVTSQFTHHLDDEALVRLLHWLEAHAARGWHIADLHRHAFAYWGFPILARLMRWHGIVASDGRISIARGFTRPEWESLLAQACVPARIKWKLPFRYSVSRLK